MFKHQGHCVCGSSNVSCLFRFLQVIAPGSNQGRGCKNSQFETLTDSKFPIQWDPGPVFKMPEKSLNFFILSNVFPPYQIISMLLRVSLGVIAWSVACPLRKQRSLDRSSRSAHNFPLPLIKEEQVISYWQKNGHLILVNCLRQDFINL